MTRTWLMLVVMCSLIVGGSSSPLGAQESRAKSADALSGTDATEAAQSISADTEEAGTVRIANIDWQTDYMDAYRRARSEGKYLLINFVRADDDVAQVALERLIASSESLRKRLASFVPARLSVDTKIELDGSETSLIRNPAFRQLEGRAGLAVIDLAHQDQPYYGRVVSAFPFTTGKYYRWRAGYLPVIVDLPPGTLTQRTMIWAVRVHPERPQSTSGLHDTQLARAAQSHSQHQANIGLQGHHNWESRYHQIRAAARAGDAVEVVAESWPNQNMIDSCLDCVASWRHSSGHWGAVKRRHRMFGYDIRRGRNGIWYGTGIFAN